MMIVDESAVQLEDARLGGERGVLLMLWDIYSRDRLGVEQDERRV
jgi:hypothetical protein